MTDNEKPGTNLTSNASSDLHILSTVLWFQERLSRAENFEDWNMWWIELEPRSEKAKLPDPWLPKRESFDRILKPWIDAGKPIPD